jgi:DNA-binding transcriptional LysR family regulator
MGLSSLHLDAFYSAAQTLNFSQAAKELHITQSALSQRIKSLEEDLGLTLFVRMPRGVALTDAGTRLLRYCQARNSLERELIEDLKGTASEGLGGELRIGGYSSVMRSIIIPALAPVLRTNPKIRAHIQNAEMRHLQEMLTTGVVDFIVTDDKIHRADMESIKLGEEEYVMVESRDHEVADDIFLDHDPQDPMTAQFFALQDGTPNNYKRSFMDEIYGICDGVALGLGRAVISRHLIARDSRLVVSPGYQSMRVPVFLHFLAQPFYTELHKQVVSALQDGCPGLLQASA